MSYCNKCGAEVNSNQDFCMSCGSRLANEASKQNENKKVQMDKMVIIGIVTVAVVGAIFSTINIVKKSSKSNNVTVQDNNYDSNIDSYIEDSNADNSNIEDNQLNDYSEKETNTTVENTNSNNNVSEVAKYYIDKYRDRDYIIPLSDSVELDFKGLNNYNSEELLIARNELFARYGFIFKGQPNLQAYFESKSWYRANPSFYGELVKEVESKNLNLIKSIEFLKYARERNASISSAFVLPNSNSAELVASDVSRLNDWELVVARNEIFARYGLEFSTKELLEHFKSKSWFVIDSSLGNDMPLTTIENKNVATILDEEKSRIESRLTCDLGE